MTYTQKANAAYIAPASRYFFGALNSTSKERIYLSTPTFDCDWYWGFGYLGNSHCHYPLDSYQAEQGSGEHRNIDMFDALSTDYDLCSALKDTGNLWKFCELFKTAYALAEVAKVFKRGGSHYSKNPCQELLKNPGMYEHINFVLLPTLFKEMDKIFLVKQEDIGHALT